MQKAVEAIQKGDWPAAERRLRKLAQGEKPAPQVLYNLAQVLLRLDKGRQAEHWFERAVEADPDYAIAWFELGRLRLESGALETAATAFERSAGADPNDADAWRNAARIRERLGAFERAEAHWTMLSEIEPEDVEARLGRARACYELGRFDEAEALLEDLPNEAKASALSLRTHVARGRLSLNAKDF